MKTYLALLRGINVGGRMLSMAALRDALSAAGLNEVRTYIQSGNVIFESDIKDTKKLAALIKETIRSKFGMEVDTVVFGKAEWKSVIEAAPKWWGNEPTRKHNLLVMIGPYDMPAVVAAIGELKPDIEAIKAGEGVVYQSLSLELFGRTTSGKLASNPIYKQMTIRNYNTSTKLLALM